MKKPRKRFDENNRVNTVAAMENMRREGKTMNEMATALKISKSALYRWQKEAKQNAPPAMKISRQVSTRKAAKQSSAVNITVKRGEKALQAQVRELKEELALMKLVAKAAIAGRLT